MCQTHGKIFCRCRLLLVAVDEVSITVNPRGACCGDDRVAARGNMWDWGVSPAAVSEPSRGPSLCFTSHQRRRACAEMVFSQYTGPGEPNLSFLLIMWYGYGERGIPAALLRVPPNSGSCHAEEGCCRCPSQPPITYSFPGVSVAMGMFSFKLWWVSVLSRHPGGLAASIHAAFPPRRKARGERIGHSRR